MQARVIDKVTPLEFLWKSREIYKNPLPFHHENFEKYDHTFKISPKPGLLIHFTCDPEITRHILQKNQKNFYKSDLQTEDLGKYIGHGLLTANGDKWKQNRKLIQPAFHKKQLATLIDTMDQVIIDELDRIEPDTITDAHAIFNDLAFKVVARSLFYLEDIDEEITRLQHITEQAQRMLIKELRIPWMQWYFNRPWLSGKNSVQHHLDLVNEGRDILRRIIENRRQDTQEYGDLLDMLLHSTYEDGTHMPDDQLIDEILVLFIAGHETTANALSFTTQLLAHNPEKQVVAHKAALAIDETTGLMEQLGSMDYIKQCVEETLRLYPPAYVTDRVALEKDQVNDVVINKDSIWLISFYEMHRRADLWEEPDAFKPERFDASRLKEYRDFYFPFGAGPRMCIGNNFAMYEMMLVLKHLVLKFKMTPVHDDIKTLPLITLKPQDAHLRFEARE